MTTQWPEMAEPVELVGDEAHVWAVPLAVRKTVDDQLWRLLSPAEHERANDFRVDDARRRFVIARGTLRRLIGGYLKMPPEAIEFAFDANGKPRLADKHSAAGLCFNVSHSGDLGLIAFASDGELGVDVEQLREVGHLEQIARRFFHPLETAAVLATPAALRSAAFLRCWTGKEAVLKAHGTGITGSLSEFQVPAGESWTGWIEPCTKSNEDSWPRCWLQQLAPRDGYVAAIACVGSKRSVRCRTFAM